MSRMLALLLALTLAPWSHPLYFQPLAGWQTGSSGNTQSAYIGHASHIRVPEGNLIHIPRER